jgi:N12 class adenine-specific DNA methylase
MRLLTALAALLGMGSGSSSAQAAAAKHEEAVIVHFDYGQKDWSRFFEFEKTLEEAIAKAAVGDYDGNELATDGSDGSMYMYGPDADALFAIIKPRLMSASFLRNVVVTLRYGAVTDPTAREKKLRLGP